eukprot:4888922-Pyramimonas_sp.AAC.1
MFAAVSSAEGAASSAEGAVSARGVFVSALAADASRASSAAFAQHSVASSISWMIEGILYILTMSSCVEQRLDEGGVSSDVPHSSWEMSLPGEFGSDLPASARAGESGASRGFGAGVVGGVSW